MAPTNSVYTFNPDSADDRAERSIVAGIRPSRSHSSLCDRCSPRRGQTGTGRDCHPLVKTGAGDFDSGIPGATDPGAAATIDLAGIGDAEPVRAFAQGLQAQGRSDHSG